MQIISRGQVNDPVAQLRAYVRRDDDAVTRVLFWGVDR